MVSVFFLLFAALTLVPAIGVVTCKNAVNAAMLMIVSFLGISGLFVLLDAYFLAVLQVLVYAGAIMVLFLFVIMLLDSREDRKIAKSKPSANFVRFFFIALLFSGLMGLAIWLKSYQIAQQEAAQPQSLSLSVDAGSHSETGGQSEHEQGASGLKVAWNASAEAFGNALFTRYVIVFELAGVLLLMAMVGVILISKRPGIPSMNLEKK